MARAVDKAARGLKRDFGEVEQLQVSMKGPADFVSTADHKAEKVLREELSKARPGYGFLLEEGGVVEGRDRDHRWIVDPLDGTTNFLHGLPHFAISIGLERAGEIVAGVVFDPLKDELFWAEKGSGAYLNARRIRVSSRRQPEAALVATGMPYHGHGRPGEFIAQLGAVMESVAGIRRLGAASLDLAYVAAGRCDAFWEEHLSPWDLAAGILLVREAGGYVTRTDGGADVLGTGSVLAANDQLHQPMLRLLRQASPAAEATARPPSTSS